MDLLLCYFLKLFSSEKKEQEVAPWINCVNRGFFEIVSKGKGFGRWVKHLITASRSGSQEVQHKYLFNMALLAVFTAFLFLLWQFLAQWFFPEFKIDYWNLVDGSIWTNFLQISFPAVIFAFFLGQLDWFGSTDPFEENTIIAESLPFKWIVSVSAGVFEELMHRGVFIYFGLIAIAISNFMFPWIVIFLGVIFITKLCMSLNLSGRVSCVFILVTGALLYYVKNLWMDNFILWINKVIFDAYYWVSDDYIKTFLIIGALMALMLFITTFLIQKRESKYGISFLEFLIRVVLFAVWAAYVLPLGLGAIENMPIMPAEANNYTALLYLSAVMWSNAKFRNSHKYQGPAGMLNSYVMGFYMFYIAFNYGLVYAMIVHFLLDAVIFTSEHVCQVIKSRHLA